jgi:DNA-binding CsgD family transcriptional regulator
MATEEHSSIDLTATLGRLGLPSVVVSREGRITWMNDVARAVFGDLEGAISLGTTVVPEDVPVARREFERKLDGVAAGTDYEIDVVTRDGRRVRAVISSVPIPGDDPDRAVFAVAWLDRQPSPTAKTKLTPRQSQVLQLLADGASTEQIATELHLTTETVRNHIRHVLKALGAHSRLEAVVLARRQGLIRDGRGK